MKCTLLVIACHVLLAENRMLPDNLPYYQQNLETRMRKARGYFLEAKEDKTEPFPDESSGESTEEDQGLSRRPCAVMIISNKNSPSMQTLIRKYRYSSDGMLIPSSVRYYLKMEGQGRRASPVLVPLNDKAFSPLGGFVRYYKEVPPIPQAVW